jgi:hypothetical protein
MQYCSVETNKLASKEQYIKQNNQKYQRAILLNSIAYYDLFVNATNLGRCSNGYYGGKIKKR